jgi:hypothetical protein
VEAHARATVTVVAGPGIDYQVLDTSNRAVGRFKGYERYYDYATNQQVTGYTNTCDNSFVAPFPNSCQANTNPFTGIISDTLDPACPTSVTPCGLPDFRVRWFWCNQAGWTGNLFQARYRIKSNEILVNSQPSLLNTYLYP